MLQERIPDLRVVLQQGISDQVEFLQFLRLDISVGGHEVVQDPRCPDLRDAVILKGYAVDPFVFVARCASYQIRNCSPRVLGEVGSRIFGALQGGGGLFLNLFRIADVNALDALFSNRGRIARGVRRCRNCPVEAFFQVLKTHVHLLKIRGSERRPIPLTFRTLFCLQIGYPCPKLSVSRRCP